MSTDKARHDVWASGDSYEKYVGRWSRLVAREFIRWLAILDGRQWLDVGCGTGEVTLLAKTRAKQGKAYGIDPASGALTLFDSSQPAILASTGIWTGHNP